MQIDPIKPTLKVPGNELLKVKYDNSLSNLAFKFNLRRYSKALEDVLDAHENLLAPGARVVPSHVSVRALGVTIPAGPIPVAGKSPHHALTLITA